MTLFQSILLGIIQGLTEFLPISSSAHLVLVPHLLGWDIPEGPAFVFDVLVQLATILAVITYFWTDIISITTAFLTGIFQGKPLDNPQARLGWAILIATIPAGIIGFLLKDVVESAFNSPSITAGFLLVTAVILLLAEYIGRQRDPIRVRELSLVDALWIGFFQAAAIFPGISRSGATITGGMVRGLTRPAAARFSFLIAIPIMLAAGVFALVDLLSLPELGDLLPLFLPGFIASAITGFISIRWLLGYLSRHSLVIFALYCAVLSISIFIVDLIR